MSQAGGEALEGWTLGRWGPGLDSLKERWLCWATRATTGVEKLPQVTGWKAAGRGGKGKGKDTWQVDEFWVLSGPWRARAPLWRVVRSFQPSIRRYLGQWEEQSPLQARAEVHLKCQAEGRVEEGLRKTPHRGQRAGSRAHTPPGQRAGGGGGRG